MYSVRSRVQVASIVVALTSLGTSALAQTNILAAPSAADAPPRPLDQAPAPQVTSEGAAPAQTTEPAQNAQPAQVAPGVVGAPAAAEQAPADAAGTPAVGEPTATEPLPGEPSEFELGLQTTQEDLQGLRTDLENFKFQWQRERDLHTAITTRYLKIGGVVQARFGWQDTAVNSAVVKDRKTSFDINSAILSFTGSLYRDYEEGRNLTYNLRFGVSKQSTGTLNNNFLNLLDAQITYNFLPTINPEDPNLTLSVGQQQLPFGLEVSATEELRPVVRNAQFTQTAGLDLARREIGAIVRGELFPLVDYGYNYRVPVIAYAVGVVNGSGPNFLDNNNAKDFIGRLAFTVPSDFNSILRQLTIGGTVYLGRQNVHLKDMARTLVSTGHSNRYGVDVYYNHWPFGATYEYIFAEDFVANGTTKADPQRRNLQRDSHTATLFLSFGEQFVAGFRNQGRFDDWWPKTYQPFLRYDRFDNNRDTDDSEITIYTAGFNVFLAETTKVQFNYNLTNNPAVDEDYGHEVLAQTQFGF